MNRTIDLQNKRQLAKIIGWSLILMAIAGGFSLGYAFPLLSTTPSTDHLRENILNNWGLYPWMVFGILITLILDLVVSYGVFAYFKKEHSTIALVSGILRLIYTAIFGLATFYLMQNLLIEERSNPIIQTNFKRFQVIWYGGLLVFGMHLILTGILMRLHQKIPTLLAFLTMVAGLAYFIVHLLKLIDAEAGIVHTLEMILVLPMILGELGLAIWLLLKGGK